MTLVHRLPRLLLLPSLVSLPAAVCGCQGVHHSNVQPAAKGSVGSESRSDVSAGVVTVPVVVPDLATAGWAVLPPQQTRRILETPMPPVTELNRSQSVEEVIEAISGRKLVWLPPEPHPEPVSYGSEAVSTRGKTLGQYLRGLIGGSTALGYPRVRMMQAAPATRTAKMTQPQPELIDVLIVTKRYIAIVAVPRE